MQVAESCSDGWSGRTSMKYDFSGKVLVSVEEHTSPGGTTDRLTLQNTYDDRGRILQSSAEMNGAVLSAAYSYDDLGRMVVKNLNGSDAEDRFSYNLQGWLTSIVSGNGGSIDICNRAIQYYDNSGNPMYGGKISSLYASHYGAASFFTDYSYDNLGRLESETRKTGYSGTIPFSADRYNYDRNGNIISVSHRSGTEIEAITETCFRTGNMLNRLLIEDEDEDPEQFTYDMNGAVTYDGYTHCTITYNVLGKPCTIEFEDGSTRENYYLSDGTKISYLLDDSLESTLHYRGSMVYKSEWDEIEDIVSERLESVAHPEGRFFASSYTSSGQPVLKNWHYVTDQVGSVVAVVDMDMMAEEDEDAAVERSEYYSYGKRVGHPAFPKVSGNRHRFNGKEEITNDASPYIDYGARTYSPALRGWLSPDPLADKYFDLSPYAFCAGDPVNVVDTDGRKVKASSASAQENIKMTLTPKEAMRIYFNKEGFLSIRWPNKSNHNSRNYLALKTLSESNIIYTFDVCDSYTNGEGTTKTFVDSKARGTIGITLIPGANEDPSPDNDVHILTSSSLNKLGQVKNTAHEGYGHAFFFELQRQGQDVSPFHHFDPISVGQEWVDYLGTYITVNGRIETNMLLDEQIKNSVHEAELNCLLHQNNHQH